MSLQGTFDIFSLPELLRMLAGSAKTGALIVEAGGLAGRIDLEGGESCAVTTTELRGPVGSVDELHERLVDVCFAVVREATGVFRFAADEPPVYDVSFRLPIESVLAEVDLLIVEWQEITDLIGSLDVRPVLASELPGADITVTASEWALLKRLDGYLSVRDLVDVQSQSMVEVCRAIADLVTRGAVDLLDDATESREQGVVRDEASVESQPFASTMIVPVAPYGPGVDDVEPGRSHRAVAASTVSAESAEEPQRADSGGEVAHAAPIGANEAGEEASLVAVAASTTSLGDPNGAEGDSDDMRDRGAILRLFSALREA